MAKPKIEELTMEIVKQYYEGNPSLFFTYAHPDAVVLSVGKGQVIEGKAAIIKSFTAQRKSPIRYDVMSMTCKSYPFAPNWLQVLLQMDIVAYFPDGNVTNVNQRLTASRMKSNDNEAGKEGESEGWLFTAAHLSVAMETQTPPVISTHISEQLLYEKTGMFQRENKRSFRDMTGLTHYISASQIVRVKGERQYSRIFMLEGESILLHKQMTELEIELGNPFIRIHRSHLVNVNYIARFWNYKVFLFDKTVLPVSRSCFSSSKKSFDLQKRRLTSDLNTEQSK